MGMGKLKRAAAFAAGAGIIAAANFAAPTRVMAEGDENPDPVFVFNRICYAQVHDVDAIQQMALKLAWKSIQDEELAQFNSYDDPTTLVGWDVQVGERLFRVGLTQAGLTDQMKTTFPDFASGTATSCSMVLDDQQDAETFMANMQVLAGKAPVSSDVPEGLLRTTTWAGGNADLKVFLFAKAPPTGKGGLLNVTLIQK